MPVIAFNPPPLETLYKIANILQISVKDLIVDNKEGNRYNEEL